MTTSPVLRTNTRWLVGLLALVMGIVAFVFVAFPPLYGLWCKVTGTALQPNDPRIAAAAPTGTGRQLEVFIESKIFHDLPVIFTATPHYQRVEVGKDSRVTYTITNTSDQTVHLRPIHQVSPINAARYFGMKICFCFRNQTLAPGETKEFPVIYSFSPDLDERVGHVTLCYSLLSAVPGAPPTAEQLAIEAELKKAIVTEGPLP